MRISALHSPLWHIPEDCGFLTYSKALEGYNISRNTLQTAFEPLVQEKTSTIPFLVYGRYTLSFSVSKDILMF